MSAEDYPRRIELTRKALIVLKKDILFRDQQVRSNEPTFSLDAEIKGQLVDIVPSLAKRTKTSRPPRRSSRASKPRPVSSDSCSGILTNVGRPSPPILKR